MRSPHLQQWIEETIAAAQILRERVPQLRVRVVALNNARMTPAGAHELAGWCRAKLTEHSVYIREHLEDLPGISDWRLEAANRPGT